MNKSNASNSRKQKSAEDLKEQVSDKGINLVPLFNSIEKLKRAATKINNQRKVLLVFLLTKISTHTYSFNIKVKFNFTGIGRK